MPNQRNFSFTPQCSHFKNLVDVVQKNEHQSMNVYAMENILLFTCINHTNHQNILLYLYEKPL